MLQERHSVSSVTIQSRQRNSVHVMAAMICLGQNSCWRAVMSVVELPLQQPDLTVKAKSAFSEVAELDYSIGSER